MFGLEIGAGAELRPLEPWRAAEFAAHVERVRADVAQYVPFGETVVDEESARRFLQGYADKQARDTGRIYGIWADGVLQGGTVFRTFDAATGVCELGVWLGTDARGRGLVTRACREMIGWAFETRGMARVEWRCDPRNTNSVAVAERLGMTLDGVLRQVFPWRGERQDEQVWSILASEWTS